MSEFRKWGAEDIEWGIGTWASPGGVTSTKIPVKQPTDNTFLGVHDVMAYGAIGNGIISDAVAIQAAIDAAEVAGGKVIFPVGQYNIGATGLTVQGNGVILEGRSPRFVGSSAFGVEFLYSGTGAAVTFGVTDVINYRNEFNNIQVRATGDAITSATAIGVKLVNQHYLTSRNSAIKDFSAGTGLYLTAAGTNMFGATCQYHGILIHQCKYGIKAVSVDASIKDNHALFFGGAVIGEVAGGIAGSVGVDIDQYTDGYRFYGTDVESFEIGYNIAGSSHVLMGSRTEFNGKAVNVTATASGTELYGHQWSVSNRDIDDAGANTIVIDKYGYTGKLALLPAANMADLFLVKKSDNSAVFSVSTDATPRVEIPFGYNLHIFSDEFATLSFKVDGPTGGIYSLGLLYLPNMPADNSAGAGYLWYDPADSNRVKFGT